MSQQEKKENFYQAYAKLLGQNLEKYSHKILDKSTCIQIYQTIYETTLHLLQNSQVHLSNEAVNYISQQFYDGILINDNQELDPNIFNQRAKVENLKTSELSFFLIALKDTDFIIPVIQEMKKRN